MKKIIGIIVVMQFVFQIHLYANDSTHVDFTSGRAIWIWNNDNIITDMVNNTGDLRDDLFDFCKNPHGNPEHKISVIFLGCSDALLNYPDSLRSFLSKAAANELVVEFLDGDPSWATYNQSIGIARINKVLEFNKLSQTDAERFQGIQFDVEPYLLKSTSSFSPPHWDTDLSIVWNMYFDFIDSCQVIIDQDNDDLYFGIAIPRWYENYVGVDGLGKLQSLTDYIAIMDYNENASVIINDAANEIDNALLYNKKVWIGVETKNVLPETVSFYEEGIEVMEKALASVSATYQDSPAYLGIAIHAYKYYCAMQSPSALGSEVNNSIDIFDIHNYENPVRSGTTIQYNLEKPMNVEIKIYNMLGQVVDRLFTGIQYKGMNSVFWRAVDYPSGVYFYQIKTNDFVQVRKMLVTH